MVDIRSQAERISLHQVVISGVQYSKSTRILWSCLRKASISSRLAIVRAWPLWWCQIIFIGL